MRWMMIITNNESALRVDCSDVSLDEIGTLRETLENELKNSARLGRPGIGLAAPQIGISKKFAIVRLDDKNKIDLVNCNIIESLYPSQFKDEGCLSFPGRIETTTRFQEIYVKGNLVEPYSFVATGLLAVVVQHELDHLNQKLFFDSAIKKVIRVRPNDPCLCGSSKKYKKCCG